MSRVQKVVLTGLAIIAVVVWYAVLHVGQESLGVYFFDVGQGDAIFIESPTGSQILIDGGPDDTVLRRLAEVMPAYDRSLDAVVLTHPHADHVNGLVNVLERYEVDTIIESGAAYATSAYEEWERLVAERKIPRIVATAGQRVVVGDGVKLDIIAPLESYDGTTRKNVHDAMVVAKLVYGETSIMLTGDMEDDLERKLLFFGADVDADILKAGHHGSKTSSSDEFLRAVSPQTAVLSFGKNNRYGHPHQEVVDRFKRFGVPVYRTDMEGTIRLAADASGHRTLSTALGD